MADPLIEVEGLCAGYGGARVLDGVGFTVERGRSLAVLGRNGAGKSTLIAALMGQADLQAGSIALRGRPIGGLPAHRRAAAGLGWVAQERDIFPSLSVEENLTVAARSGPWTLARVYGLFPALEAARRRSGRQLSGGEQQMLAIARALMLNPALLLLDEPLEGLAPVTVRHLADMLAAMARQEGQSFILAEQQVGIALDLTDQALILERGRVVHRAPSRELAGDGAVLEALLGVRAGTS
jgi:branched-chain amino acid transport system ATP-binding protein